MEDDIKKIKKAQERINKVLGDFKMSKDLPKSKIIKYYKGLEVTYDEFISKLEHSLLNQLNESDLKELADQIKDF